jgi:hypothetical protein
MFTPLLAGIPRSDMGDKIGNLSPLREDIIAVLDLLITDI